MSWGYLFGAGAVLVFWIVGGVISKGDFKPWALAISHSTVGGKKQRETVNS